MKPNSIMEAYFHVNYFCWILISNSHFATKDHKNIPLSFNSRLILENQGMHLCPQF